jgi:hypothetical protein
MQEETAGMYVRCACESQLRYERPGSVAGEGGGAKSAERFSGLDKLK